MNVPPKSTPRLLRLLPSVVVVGTGLLILNASGLVHQAYAEINRPAASDAMAPPPASANKDFVSDDAQLASASEVDILTNLSKRRSELDASIDCTCGLRNHHDGRKSSSAVGVMPGYPAPVRFRYVRFPPCAGDHLAPRTPRV